MCTAEAERHWGRNCGNLRDSREFTFSEVRIPSVNGYDVPGWRIKAANNGMSPARGAIMLVPAGGSDRREVTKFVRFLLSQRLDVLSLDLDVRARRHAPCQV